MPAPSADQCLSGAMWSGNAALEATSGLAVHLAWSEALGAGERIRTADQSHRVTERCARGNTLLDLGSVSARSYSQARGGHAIRLVTARTVQGMAPYPGQARFLALGFWPECFRRFDVKGGRRPFPEETRSALEIEGKHVTIQGPYPEMSPAAAYAPRTAGAGLAHCRPVDAIGPDAVRHRARDRQ
jgi:hypothetical protein